jgi:tetratricopeptide (TPR) repeat protein
MEIKDFSDISYLLPPITKTTEPDSWESEDSALELDFMVLAIEYERSMKRENFDKAADCITQLIEMSKQNPRDFPAYRNEFAELHLKRAYAYAMAKDYDAAVNDLQWIEQHAPVSSGNQAEVLEGIVQLLQGKEATLLQKQAAKGNLLAMLLANQPENLEAPKTEWVILPREEQIQKLVEGRHYTLAIEQIDKMDLHTWDWQKRMQNDKWIALRGVCYALKGNHLQAINELKDHGYYASYNKELAVIYAMAGEKERAEKALKKQFEPDMQSGLIRQWMAKS